MFGGSNIPSHGECEKHHHINYVNERAAKKPTQLDIIQQDQALQTKQLIEMELKQTEISLNLSNIIAGNNRIEAMLAQILKKPYVGGGPCG